MSAPPMGFTLPAHVLLTPALARIIDIRADQIANRGYTAEADDENGAGGLTRKSYAHLLRAQQTKLSAIQRHLQTACDDTSGRIDLLDDRALAALDRALATSGALIIAAMESLDRFRARQREAGQ